MLGAPIWDNVGTEPQLLFIMNSAGEEDEEQVDYGEDSGGEKSLHHEAADAVFFFGTYLYRSKLP